MCKISVKANPRENPKVRVILITAWGDIMNVENCVKAVKLGAFEVITKVKDEKGTPVDKIKSAINQALKSLEWGERVTANTLIMRKLKASIQSICEGVVQGGQNQVVFLVGEIGTGKERIANWINSLFANIHPIHSLNPKARITRYGMMEGVIEWDT